MFNSLRTRLTLMFLVLIIIPLTMVSSVIAWRGYNTLQNQAVEFQSELANRVAIDLEGFFNEHRAEIFALTQVYGFDTLESGDQRSLLLTLLNEQPAYYQLTTVDAAGEEQIRVARGSVITESDLISREDDPLFQEAMETREVTFGSVYFNEDARDRLMTIAYPIEDLYTGEISNVLITDVRFQNLADAVLREVGLSNDEDVYIISQDGTVLAHRDPNLVMRETKYTLPEDDGRTTGLNGDDVVLATNTVFLGNQELIVVAQIDYSTATALANDLTSIAGLITVVTLVVAGIVVVVLVDRVVKPIRKMAEVATEVEKGHLEARVEEHGKDEVAVLGRAFNSMAAELQRTLEGLRHNVEQLEASNKEREQLIQELQAAKRIADENSRLKSEFLATMSHELRTPLNAIEGFTSIMLSGMGIELSPRAEDMVRRVSSNSKRLLNLINDFLDLSRIEAGRLELVMAPFSLYELVGKWQNQVGVLADEKDLDFVVDISSNMPETILGDDDALSKIAINLLGNAFKFTKEGQVTLKVDRTEDEWSIAISDTGIGIPAHAREYIFDEFRQVDGSSKRLFGGTGLGLALVQRLSRAMKGSVTLESEVDKGSTFTVTLPLEIPEEVEQGAVL